MDKADILSALPYEYPFLFVDSLEEVTAEGARGSYTFREDLPCYRGHFKGNPVTPGVLLTECCAQIGLVCLGLYLAVQAGILHGSFALSSSEMEFFIPVYPGERVRVVSVKKYFRFQKLKCSVQMFNTNGDLVCKGTLAGMLITTQHG